MSSTLSSRTLLALLAALIPIAAFIALSSMTGGGDSSQTRETPQIGGATLMPDRISSYTPNYPCYPNYANSASSCNSTDSAEETSRFWTIGGLLAALGLAATVFGALGLDTRRRPGFSTVIAGGALTAFGLGLMVFEDAYRFGILFFSIAVNTAVIASLMAPSESKTTRSAGVQRMTDASIIVASVFFQGLVVLALFNSNSTI